MPEPGLSSARDSSVFSFPTRAGLDRIVTLFTPVGWIRSLVDKFLDRQSGTWDVSGVFHPRSSVEQLIRGPCIDHGCVRASPSYEVQGRVFVRSINEIIKNLLFL